MKFHFLQRYRPLLQPAATWAAALLLSAGQFSGEHAPFALAIVAAAGPGLPGILSLFGAGIGGLLFFDFQPGLRFLAAAILIFSANIAFHDTPLWRNRFFIPVLSAVLYLLVQSVYLLYRPPAIWVLCLLAAGSLATASFFLIPLTDKQAKPQARRAGLFVLAAGLLTSAIRAGIEPFSVGRSMAAALALFSSVCCTPPQGVTLGLCIGLLLDLSPENPQLLYTVLYAFACGLTALCRSLPRLLQGLLFLLPSLAIPLLFSQERLLPFLLEALAGTLLYLLLPRQMTLPRLSGTVTAPKRVQSQQPSGLRQSAAAFRELYDSFFRGVQPSPPENPSVLFDRAAEQVCRNCVLCSSCWQQHYNTTYNAFNDACPAMLRRGQALAQDFPLHFATRCVHFSRFLAAVNVELRAYLLRRQYHQRLTTAQLQAREQYVQLSDLLASTYASEAVPASAGSSLLRYQVGTGLRPQSGQRVCGDQLACFEVEDTLYLLLSDGMGSGEAAHREAATTIRLLQQFLKAGIQPAPALKTLNAALALRGESGGSFTTIDLLALRRSSGEASLYKYGAAPTYWKRGGHVSRLSNSALPAGLHPSGEAPNATRLQLQRGSFLVMVSDGIADETCDEWLQNLLAGWNGHDANTLTALILSESRNQKGLSDDCAVLVLALTSDGENSAKEV